MGMMKSFKSRLPPFFHKSTA